MSILSQQAREQDLAAMTNKTLDVLVVGGGVTGAGIALDAATRGLHTGIVEAQDWAAGTSSRSSKLVHGGLRYLQMLDFSLVSEALRERDLLLNDIAPHLVSSVSFLYPLQHRVWQRAYIAAGIGLYDLLARVGTRTRKRGLPTHRHYTRAGVKQHFPDIRNDALVGAVRYWDARVDDARLVLGLLRTAVSHGARAASRTRVTSMIKDAGGRVVGARVRDLEQGQRHEIRARHVIAATGVWTEDTQDLGGVARGLKVLASKGIHIVVPRERIRGQCGIILRTDKSVLFIIPWERHWLIGTTDTPYSGSRQHPVATSADVEYVIERANTVLDPPLSRSDVTGFFAGLRPLVQPRRRNRGDLESAKVSREHTISEACPGMTVIAGGKLTTYRIMAADALDFALGATRAARQPSVTAHTPLVGAVGLADLQRRRDAIAADYGWTRGQIDHLLGRYGSDLPTLLGLIDADPSLGRPLAGSPGYLRVEIAFGVTHEGALHLDDLLLRRTRLGYESAHIRLDALVEIAAIAAPLLGWDEARIAAEIASHRDRVSAERRAAGVVASAET